MTLATVPKSEFSLPDARIEQMIAQANQLLFTARTIPEVKKVCDMAEAIAAITRKVELAMITKRYAMKLLIEAEQKLGSLSAEVRGRSQDPTLPTKRQILEKDFGINHRRANVAERLAKATPQEIETVLDRGVKTMNGVVCGLGIIANGPELREKKLARLVFLTEECIETLERAVKGQKPHPSNVVEFRRRFSSIKVA